MIFRDPLQHTPLTPWKCGKWTRMLSVPIPRRSQATATTTKLVERKLFYAKYSKLKTMSTIPIWFVLLCHLHWNDHVYSVAHLLCLSLCSHIVFVPTSCIRPRVPCLQLWRHLVRCTNPQAWEPSTSPTTLPHHCKVWRIAVYYWFSWENCHFIIL